VADSPSARLAERGIHLPPPPAPRGTYRPVVVSGGTAYVSGQILLEGSEVAHPGLVDRDVSFETARDLARRAVLQGLSALDEALGSLDRIRQVLRVGVYVASAPGFVRQHEVANGATDVLVEIFGESGRPARTSVGVASLPLNAPVEVELVVAVE
jgi:enamine deaminase RidA (YjgF/YER057c/UK114 family)